MVLGKLPVPGLPIVGQRPIALAVGVNGGCLDIFSLAYHFSLLSPSLLEAAQYKLKGQLNSKQPTKIKHFSQRKKTLVWEKSGNLIFSATL